MPDRRRWIWPVLAALALEGCAEAAPDNAAVFDRAWSVTQRRYWDPAMRGVDWAAARDRWRPRAVAAADTPALYAAINGLLGELRDSHAFALSPSERARGEQGPEDRTSGGFGLSFDPLPGGGWEVASVTPHGPAAQAGVEIGWRLIAIDGRPFAGDRDFGAGDRATLSFRDDAGRRRDMALTGAPLPDVQTQRSRTLPGGVLLLAFDGFDPGVDDWIAGEIATARPRALILDLRENDGGASDALDRVAGLFFHEKRVVLRLVRRRETTESTIGAGRDTFDGPLAVLVGPRSASAAEALAALVDESGRGTTIGQRTAGALTGATDHRLPDGGLLSTPEYDVRTAGGRRLEGVGLTPRIAVAASLAERRRGDDPALACARAVVTGGRCAAR